MNERNRTEIMERLSALLDGESEHPEMDWALLRDAAAAETYRDFLAQDRLLRTLPEPEVSPAFEVRVMAALPVKGAPFKTPRLVWGALAAGLLLTMGLGLYLSLPEATIDAKDPMIAAPGAVALDTGEPLSLQEEFTALNMDTTLWLAEWAAPSWDPISGSVIEMSGDQLIETLATLSGDTVQSLDACHSLLQVVDAIEQFTETETAVFSQLLRAALTEV